MVTYEFYTDSKKKLYAIKLMNNAVLTFLTRKERDDAFFKLQEGRM